MFNLFHGTGPFPPENKKISDFLMFSRGIERDKWHEMFNVLKMFKVGNKNIRSTLIDGILVWLWLTLNIISTLIRFCSVNCDHEFLEGLTVLTHLFPESKKCIQNPVKHMRWSFFCENS